MDYGPLCVSGEPRHLSGVTEQASVPHLQGHASAPYSREEYMPSLVLELCALKATQQRDAVMREAWSTSRHRHVSQEP